MPSSPGQGRCDGDQSFKIRVAGERDGGAGLTVHGQKFIGRLQEGSILFHQFLDCFATKFHMEHLLIDIPKYSHHLD
jgi:hypothetical protein